MLVVSVLGHTPFGLFNYSCPGLPPSRSRVQSAGTHMPLPPQPLPASAYPYPPAYPPPAYPYPYPPPSAAYAGGTYQPTPMAAYYPPSPSPYGVPMPPVPHAMAAPAAASTAHTRFQFANADAATQNEFMQKQRKQEETREILAQQVREKQAEKAAAKAKEEAWEMAQEARIARDRGAPLPPGMPAYPEAAAVVPPMLQAGPPMQKGGRKFLPPPGGGNYGLQAAAVVTQADATSPLPTAPLSPLKAAQAEARKKALFSNPFMGTSNEDPVEKRNREKMILAQQIEERKLQKAEEKRKEQERERKEAEKLARSTFMLFAMIDEYRCCVGVFTLL
jgi:hypothetical protein